MNGFNPTLGQDYQVLSYASVTGAFATISGLPSGMTATQTGTAFNLDTAAAGADLAMTSVNAPTTADVGQAIAVGWQVKDVDATAAGGSWQDSVSSLAHGLRHRQLHPAGHGGAHRRLRCRATYSCSLNAAVPALVRAPITSSSRPTAFTRSPTLAAPTTPWPRRDSSQSACRH